MAKFTSQRLTRDVSYDTGGEQKFKKTLTKSPKASGLLKEYLGQRGKRGYSKKTWNKFMRKKGPRAMSRTSRKSIESYLNPYGKSSDSAAKAAQAQPSAAPKKSSWFSKPSLSDADKQKVEKRSDAALKRETRSLRNQFGSGKASFTRSGGFDSGSKGRTNLPPPPRMPPPPPRPPSLG
ncbi:hypothetical protein KKH43_01220 [Patescibacteria group bacterium]|nr:hypothetical protein [Patescibacteria group bacterium]